MNAEQFNEEAILEEALSFDSVEDRRAYLEGACKGNQQLRAQVESLIEAHLVAGGFLSGKPARLGPEAQPGTLIGRYKLLEKIGEGGMGVVYMAEQQEPVRRKVALKVIKLGMDTKQVIARFEAERQALALMDHPNIARVLDAGLTDTGRPYFVMELVQGVPITKFCEKNRLSAQERIKLFIPVCQAIQSAHQKGIIHRDLKPTNILVTLNAGVPHPMVIDFGVAKATNQKLTEKTVFTHFAAMIGTPAYMSPEQAEMSQLDVDTRTDIYGLGVLLYELLTGTTPFPEKRLRSVGYQEMQRIIMEEQPERPSTRLRRTQTLGKSVSARSPLLAPRSTDLDWIVMKCLEKDRARRYETANGLAMDLQRHLNNEPVVARPPSTAYQVQKFVRRNQVMVTAAAIVGVVLILGTLVSVWQAVRATQAKRLAEANERKAQIAQTHETEERRRAEAQAYVANINLAQQAWEQNSVGRLRDLLTETAAYPNHGFEWYYWQRQMHLDLLTLRGHAGGVVFVAFSPDGGRILTGSYDGTARVWDAASGHELLNLDVPRGVSSAAFSWHGQRIVTGHDRSAEVWDTGSGHELFSLTGHGDIVQSVAFSSDGRRIATGSDDRTAMVWDATTGRELFTLASHSNKVRSVVFSWDGQRIATGSYDGTAKVWDAVTGKQLFSLQGHGGGLNCVALSPDGQRIATGDWNGAAKVWEAASGVEPLALKGHNDAIIALAFSPDSQRIATASWDNTAKVCDANGGNELLTLRGHTGGLLSVAFSPDSQRIATGSMDGTAKVWNAAGSKETLTFKGCTATFSPDGQRIVTGSLDGTATLWDAASGRELLTFRSHSRDVRSVAFSPDGQRIVTGSLDHTAKVWEAASGNERFTLNGHKSLIQSVAYSPDGHKILTGSTDGTAKVWDAATGAPLQVLTVPGSISMINCVAFSPDGGRIVTGSDDPATEIWDAASGKLLLTLQAHSQSVAFSPDGQKIVTGSGAGTATVFDTTSGKPLLTFKVAGGGVWSVAFSPDGQRIVTGSGAGTVKVWDAATGKELLTLRGGTGSVFSVAFSPDGGRIVTASADETAKVWTAATAPQVEAWEREEKADQLKPTADRSGRSGRWEQAAADLAAAIEHNPADPELWHWLAAVQVQRSQIEAYRAQCRKSLERFASTTNPGTANQIAKDCLIRADSGADLARVAALADLAVTEGRQSIYLPYFQFCKGLAEYRQARFTSAADWMEVVLTNRMGVLSLDTAATMVLAMAEYRSGHREQARASLAKGSEIEERLPRLESGDLGEDWNNWIIAHALSREAKALIEGQPGLPRQPQDRSE